MQKVRVDKWLWSVRIFKSRTVATAACKSGKIKVNDHNLKPSALITLDQEIFVKKNGFDLTFKVIKLLDKRVSATLAQECYENLTPESEMNKFKNWFIGKAASERRDQGMGRPTKRERRDIDGFKEEQYEEFFDFDE